MFISPRNTRTTILSEETTQFNQTKPQPGLSRYMLCL